MLAVLPSLVAFVLVPRVYAWGELGHETIGFVAMNFLSANTLKFVQENINSTFDHSLGPAAPWADSVRSETAFKFSAPFHFIDAEDDPLAGQCSVIQNRDCGSTGCILTAIANYTQRVQDTKLDATQRSEALMFIDHFIGDIGQPLHVEAFEVGGNDIDAICAKKKTNLHAAWDTGMIETFLDPTFGGSVTAWATNLTAEINSGKFKSDAAGWIECSSITETQPNSKRAVLRDRSIADEGLSFPGIRTNTPRSLAEQIRAVTSARSVEAALPELECPLIWAQEANAFDCTDVFDFTTGQDLCEGTYFENAIPIIELQLAKQGFRLAAWLNVIIDGKTDLP